MTPVEQTYIECLVDRFIEDLEHIDTWEGLETRRLQNAFKFGEPVHQRANIAFEIQSLTNLYTLWHLVGEDAELLLDATESWLTVDDFHAQIIDRDTWMTLIKPVNSFLERQAEKTHPHADYAKRLRALHADYVGLLEEDFE